MRGAWCIVCVCVYCVVYGGICVCMSCDTSVVICMVLGVVCNVLCV